MLRVEERDRPVGLTEPIVGPEYWNPPSLSELARRPGFDIESLPSGFGFGLYWTGVHEHLTWSRRVAHPKSRMPELVADPTRPEKL